jgi:hypothetical protein
MEMEKAAKTQRTGRKRGREEKEGHKIPSLFAFSL